MEKYWTRYGGITNRIAESLYLLLSRRKRKSIGERQFNTYFKFGFVRNPRDRIVSLYNRREGLIIKNKMEFEEYVDWINYSSSTCVHPVPHRHQFDWFVDPHGNVIVDFIGKFENLQNDWEFVSKNMGIEVHLPHKNRNLSNIKHYTEYYTNKTKDIIANKFRIDIEYFGYEFGS